MTLRKATCALAAAACATLPVIGVAKAQNESQNQQQSPSSFADTYRGMFVCEQQRGSVDILHVPLDMVLRGNEVQFARPLFNLRGTRVLGSELGNGSIDASGKVRVTSIWDFGGIAVHGDYSGTLTPNGGTLTGTQWWRGTGGEVGSRTCHAALVSAPNAHLVTAK